MKKIDRERYLSAIVKIQHHLLSASQPDYGLIMTYLGEASGVSRAYYFENSTDGKGNLLMSKKAEWCDNGVVPEIDNSELQNLPYDFFPQIESTLRQAGILNLMYSDFNDSEREILDPQGVLAVLFLPIFVNGLFHGFFGFDNCHEERLWTKAEIELLQSATMAVSVALERIANKKNLRISEEHFRSLTSNIPGAIYRCAFDRDWTIEFISGHIEHISGYSPEDFINGNRSYASIIHPEDVELVERTVCEEVENQRSFVIEYRIICSDNTIKWVYEKGQGVYNAEGNILCIDGVIFDITNRKNAEQERERLHNLLQEAHQETQELEELRGELLAIVAHDINNPLTSILLMGEMLSISYTRMTEEQRFKNISAIISSAKQIQEISAGILSSERIRNGQVQVHLEPISITETAVAVVHALTESASRKGITISCHSFENYMVLADKSFISETLENLLSNAIKFSPYGTKVWINISSFDNMVRCEVQDEGPGINPEDQKKLFKRFVRLTPRPTSGESSTGLGLSITKRMVEMMNGKIWYKPGCNGGSSFVFEMPSLTVNTFKNVVNHIA